jgi:hypothetical protein
MFSEDQLEQLRSFPDVGKDELIRFFTLTSRSSIRAVEVSRSSSARWSAAPEGRASPKLAARGPPSV